jgi:N-formylglutamate deformylase
MLGPVLRLLQSRQQALSYATMACMPPTIRSVAGSTPLVLDSPHSGIHYPADFGFTCDLATLRRAEDTHVEKLYDFAPELGIAWVEALFPRSYLDANRNTNELDETLLSAAWPGELATEPAQLAKVRLGKGLIWRYTDDGVPIYQRLLSVDEVQQRIAQCWQPYHAAVAQAIDAAHARHGYCLHINCHSMPAVASSHATEFPGLVHADFVIGNRDDTTASPAWIELMAQHLRDAGYSVAINHPYKGVELVRRYSNPAAQRHSIQLEINRRLYMNEHTLEMTEGFAQLKAHLQSLVKRLLDTDMQITTK